MVERERIVCPDCGVGMNLHAEKVDYAAEELDEEFGGAVEEFHTCPACGRTEAWPAA